MPQIRRFVSRFAAFFRADKADSDLTREINAHLSLLEDEFVAKGMTLEEARYAAKRAFGGVEQTKERQRETRTFLWLAGWAIDLKLGAAPISLVRSILSPAFIKILAGILLGGIPTVALIYARLDLGISVRMIVVVAVLVAGFIIAVALISSIWPIRRALKIQPTDALRIT